MSQLRDRTILVVDDEPDLVDVTAEILEIEGARTLRAHGGHAALELLARERVDAVLSDVRMPAGNGLDLLRGLNARPNPAARPPVTLVTGYSELSVEQAYDLGAHAILSKPADFTALTEQVVRMLVPRERRWREAAPAPAVTVEVQRVSIGTHGLFVHAQNMLCPGAAVRLIYVREEGTVPIDGVVRWARPQATPDLPAGFGFEITSLPDPMIAPWLAQVECLAPLAYIPRR